VPLVQAAVDGRRSLIRLLAAVGDSEGDGVASGCREGECRVLCGPGMPRARRPQPLAYDAAARGARVGELAGCGVLAPVAEGGRRAFARRRRGIVSSTTPEHRGYFTCSEQLA